MSNAREWVIRSLQRRHQAIPGRVPGFKPKPAFGTGARFVRWAELTRARRVKSSARVQKG